MADGPHPLTGEPVSSLPSHVTIEEHLAEIAGLTAEAERLDRFALAHGDAAMDAPPGSDRRRDLWEAETRLLARADERRARAAELERIVDAMQRVEEAA